ncbi:hypothetical protein BI364_08375 [Acidihalobacter yilgarnensis]|uniref:Glycosyltransferase n=1 Tax=Acidihalobacter yilgarnensis TaxID=2819280 RepID=A0A1D8IND6_9GAMM|nr:TIGR04282 family arsenosugar biosynthesis glycosyltransferase [Acidihalobacter yilgarnensis]AOU97979.1 hypothetical protein BI364_08375 [Acidihalobacter yilgarnensis]
MSDVDFHIAVFTKLPVPGQVKTRLVPTVGYEGAARIQSRLIVGTLACANQATGGNISLWVAGEVDHPFMLACSRRFDAPVYGQCGADLGARMRAAMQELLREHRRVLLIGTDCPAMTLGVLRNAAIVLDGEQPIVFIPAQDGGYVLVGVLAQSVHDRAALLDALFLGIIWSTETVMHRTRERLAERRIGWAELPALWDLDRPADLARAQELRLIPLRLGAGPA